METYYIELDTELSEWEIIKRGFDRDSGKVPLDAYFGKERVDKDNKILWLYDVYISSECVSRIENKRRFKEKALFKVLIDEQFKNKFTGNFVDALKYIRDFWEKAKKAEMESLKLESPHNFG